MAAVGRIVGRAPSHPDGTGSDGDDCNEDDTAALDSPLSPGAPRQRGGFDRTETELRQRELASDRVVRMAREVRLQAKANNANPRDFKSLPGFLEVCDSSTSSTVTADAAHTAAPVRIDGLVIIFDWDDTLFPTWFLTEVVRREHGEVDANEPLPDGSPFISAFWAHAKALQSLLTKASEIGQVGIVTLAKKPWVTTTAKYLEGFDVISFLKELNIPIVYARECCRRQMAHEANDEDGRNVWMVMKTMAMKKTLKRLYGKATWRNVVSIGDSIVEREAIKELLWNHTDSDGNGPLCKTVKLMDDPSCEQLTAELVLLASWIQAIGARDEDFDFSMDDMEGGET